MTMKDEVVTREVRVVRKQASQSKRVASGGGGHTANTELRQERIDRRSRKTSRRDQVAPSDGTKRMNRSGGSQRRSSSSKKSQLKLDTTAKGLRSNADLRSPGQRKSPVFQDNADDDAAAEQPIPDFITQTDRYGNASTPRNKDAARVPSSPTEETTPDEDDSSHVEACAETFLDSLRLVCCCLAPEQSGGDGDEKQQQQQAIVSAQKENVPRLLPAMHPDDAGKKCLVLDLDETLVHSSFRAVPGADFIIPVQIEDVVHFVYVMKRPGVDEFLVEMAKYYEVVIYTASLNKYADPLLDLLDPHRTIRYRLFRESCVYYEGNYIKDMSLIDRDLSQSIIVDNSPSSYLFHPENAIDCSSFIDDPRDRELDQIGDFLKGIKDVKEVRGVCQQWREWPQIDLEGP